MSAREELLEAWWANHRINERLIEAISEEGMAATLSTRGGRDVVRQFAHMHNIRIWHLEKRAADLVGEMSTFASKYRPSRDELTSAMQASAEGVATFLGDVIDGVPERRGFRRGIFTTLAYFVAHESHHRGSILLTLKQRGHLPGKEVTMGIWGWDRI